MSDLNWNLRDVLFVFKDSRLPVFVSIFLHKNTRNRSWPSNDLIADETGLSSAPISAAIGWMIESNVVMLVPFEKRIGLELKLPNRKNIYQLTGVVLVGDEYYPYLNLTPEGWQSIATDLEDMGNSLLSKQLNDTDSLLSKCLESKRLESKRKGIKELNSEVPKKITKKVVKKDSAASAAQRPRDLIFDAVAKGNGIEDVNGEGGRIGKISNWLKGTYEGKGKEKMGFISSPASVEHIEKFFEDWPKDLDPPLDFVKFVENWRKWAGSKRKASEAPKSKLPGFG